MTRRERYDRSALLILPFALFVAFPLLIMIVAAIVGDHADFVVIRDYVINNPWYMFPVLIISVPLIAWAVKMVIVDDIRQESRLRKGDELLLKFAPDHYACRPLSLKMKIALAAFSVACFTVLIVLAWVVFH